MRSFFPQTGYGPAGFNAGSVGQNFLPSADNAYDLGSSALSWNDVFADGTVYSGNSTSAGGFRMTDVWHTYSDGANIQTELQNGRHWRIRQLSAGVADVGAFQFGSDTTLTAGAYILDLQNNGTSKWSCDDQGRMVLTKTAAAGANVPTTINVPGTGAAAQTGWIEIEVGGAIKYLPYWSA